MAKKKREKRNRKKRNKNTTKPSNHYCHLHHCLTNVVLVIYDDSLVSHWCALEVRQV